MTSKERAELRAKANGLETIFQIGKGGITDAVVEQVDSALTARELIKLRVLETSPVPVRAAAQQLADAVQAEVVQVIGTKMVLYRENTELRKNEKKKAIVKKAASTGHVYGRKKPKEDARTSVGRRGDGKRFGPPAGKKTGYSKARNSGRHF